MVGLRPLLFGGLLAGCVHPAHAIVRMWRAEGTVNNLQGTVSLLPLTAEPGDPMVMEFSYDDAAPDQVADPNNGRYALVSTIVTIAGETLDFVGTNPLENRIQTQVAGSFDSWNLTTCRGACDPDDDDEARLAFFVPSGRGDALVPQPQPEEADTVQFLLRSTNASTAEEAFLVGDLEALIYVPEPGAPLCLAAGALALLAARIGRRGTGLRHAERAATTYPV